MSQEPLTEAIQHYLREIYKLGQADDRVSVTALARAQNVSPASASAMVKKLDALEQANAALEDDLTVSERDGRGDHCRPFTREEVLKPLEAWFFGR